MGISKRYRVQWKEGPNNARERQYSYDSKNAAIAMYKELEDRGHPVKFFELLAENSGMSAAQRLHHISHR